jgi:hydrogenase maturation factor HypF (carbamoyltransferase family)
MSESDPIKVVSNTIRETLARIFDTFFFLNTRNENRAKDDIRGVINSGEMMLRKKNVFS